MRRTKAARRCMHGRNRRSPIKFKDENLQSEQMEAQDSNVETSKQVAMNDEYITPTKKQNLEGKSTSVFNR